MSATETSGNKQDRLILLTMLLPESEEIVHQLKAKLARG